MTIICSPVVTSVITRLITSIIASMISLIHDVVIQSASRSIYRSTEVPRRGIVLPAPWYWYYNAIGCVTAEALSIVNVV